MTRLVPAPTAARKAGPDRRWLVVTRAAWLLVLLLGLALLVPNLRAQFDQFQVVCSGQACANFLVSAAQAAQLSRLGLALPLVAAYFTALAALQALVFVAVAAVIFWRKSDDRLALLMMFALVIFGIGNALNVNAPPATATDFLLLLFQGLGRASLLLFFFLFPNGRFVPSWTRWLAPLALAREMVGAFFPGSWVDALFFVVAPLILLMQVYRYRSASNAIQRQQTKWVVYGSVLGVGTYASLTLVLIVAAPRGAGPGGLEILLFNTGIVLALSLIPISVGVAILRAHLWDIDILIRRTLLYSVLTALLAAVYFGLVIVLQSVLIALTGAARSELVTVLSTLAIAALFVPLRGRLQGFIDRRFFRGKYDSAKTLAQFSAGLRDQVNLEDLSAQLLGVVEDTMQPETVNLWLRGKGQRP